MRHNRLPRQGRTSWDWSRHAVCPWAPWGKSLLHDDHESTTMEFCTQIWSEWFRSAQSTEWWTTTMSWSGFFCCFLTQRAPSLRRVPRCRRSWWRPEARCRYRVPESRMSRSRREFQVDLTDHSDNVIRSTIWSKEGHSTATVWVLRNILLPLATLLFFTVFPMVKVTNGSDLPANSEQTDIINCMKIGGLLKVKSTRWSRYQSFQYPWAQMHWWAPHSRFGSALLAPLRPSLQYYHTLQSAQAMPPPK